MVIKILIVVINDRIIKYSTVVKLICGLYTYVHRKQSGHNERDLMERERERAINDFLNKINVNQIKLNIFGKGIETVDACFSSAVVKVR